MNIWFIFIICISLGKIYCRTGALEKGGEYYSNYWLVQLQGDLDEVQEIANDGGFQYEKAPNFPGLFLFHHPRHPKRTKFENENFTQKLRKHPKVSHAQQILNEKREVRQTSSCPRVNKSAAVSNFKSAVDDKYFNYQWYMQDCRASKKDGPPTDIYVVPVWYKYKFFGEGIIIIIIDDGLETTHPDLEKNYNPAYGYDLIDNDNTPDPKHLPNRIFSHGTRCGGTAAMEINNKICGTGVAPHATLGAVRLLGIHGSRDDKDGMALTFKVEEVDIMTNSWGPTDDGLTMTYPGEYTRAALKRGIKKGRRRKGVIYIFAGGNGKPNGDMCGCDPFVSSIYTIAVASADQNGKITHFSERCASIMVTTYSGDKSTSYNVITTDVSNKCTTQHTGTSASAPIVAGAVALVFQARNELTWRDIHHIFAYTSQVNALQNNKGWVRNGAGIYVSHDFGFGMLNVLKMVEFALSMKLVPKETICVIPFELKDYDTEITSSKPFVLEAEIDACESKPTEVNYTEHVQLVVNVDYTRRGDLEINLTSPSNTTSHLLEPRIKDSFKGGLNNWTFSTLHSWGECPKGAWTVKIFDSTNKERNKGKVNALTLVIRGTKEPPDHYANQRTYYDFKLPD